MQKNYIEKTKIIHTKHDIKMTGNIKTFQSRLNYILENIEKKFRKENTGLYINNFSHSFQNENSITTECTYTLTEYTGKDKQELIAYMFDEDINAYDILYFKDNFHKLIRYVEDEDFNNLYEHSKDQLLDYDTFNELLLSNDVLLDKDQFTTVITKMLLDYGYAHSPQDVVSILENRNLKDLFLSECPISITDTYPKERILDYAKDAEDY